MKTTHLPSKLLGLSGNAASGKDTIAGCFVDCGFNHESTSDLVREEIAARGLTTSRELQTQIANEMRSLMGNEYFVVEALNRAIQRAPEKPLILSGIYAPSEAAFIVDELKGDIVVVISHDEDLEKRYQRIRARNDSARDAMSYEEFLRAHERENSGATPNEANLLAVREIAKYQIVNDGDLALARLQVEKIARDVLG